MSLSRCLICKSLFVANDGNTICSICIKSETDYPRGNGKLELAFWEFHIKHPEIYSLLVRQARKLKSSGAKHSTIQLCYEGIRGALPIEEDHCGVQLNNNHTAFYSRLIMNNEPDLKEFFRLRKQRIQSTLGPDNDALESSDHRF